MTTATTSQTDTLMTPTETAERLGVTPGTLAVWRCARRYSLGYVKVGRCVRYRASEVERFIEAGTVEPTNVNR